MAHDRVKSVLVYGDSNTWGYNPDSSSNRQANHRFLYEQRWTTLCQSLLGPGYNVIPEGLNGRTTVYSDEISTEGEYDCNGRTTLAAVLHSHKPLDVIVLALGANDLKSKYSATPRDIAIGVRILAKDIEKLGPSLGHFVPAPPSSSDGKSTSHAATHTGLVAAPPKLLIVGPPHVQLTALNRLWGFPDDVAANSRRLAALMVVLSKELGVDYVDVGGAIAPSPLDGVHYSVEDQPAIARMVADKILAMTQN